MFSSELYCFTAVPGCHALPCCRAAAESPSAASHPGSSSGGGGGSEAAGGGARVFGAAPYRVYSGHKQDVLDLCWSKTQVGAGGGRAHLWNCGIVLFSSFGQAEGHRARSRMVLLGLCCPLGAAATRTTRVQHACAMLAACVRHACDIRAAFLRRACVTPAACCSRKLTEHSCCTLHSALQELFMEAGTWARK